MAHDPRLVDQGKVVEVERLRSEQAQACFQCEQGKNRLQITMAMLSNQPRSRFMELASSASKIILALDVLLRDNKIVIRFYEKVEQKLVFLVKLLEDFDDSFVMGVRFNILTDREPSRHP